VKCRYVNLNHYVNIDFLPNHYVNIDLLPNNYVNIDLLPQATVIVRHEMISRTE